MLRSIATWVGNLQVHERTIELVVLLTGRDKRNRDLQRVAKEVVRANKGSGASEHFCAGSTIMQLDELAARDPKTRDNLFYKHFSSVRMRSYYNKRTEIVRELYERQPGADASIPRVVYDRLFEEIEKHRPSWEAAERAKRAQQSA